MNVESTLDAALSDSPGAVEATVALWREVPHPRIARHLLRLADAHPTKRKAPRTSVAFQPVWMETCKGKPDVADLGWLAAHLGVRVPLDTSVAMYEDHYVETKYAALLERLHAAFSLPPDPRMTHAMLAVFRKSWPLGWTREGPAALYGPALDCVTKYADVSAIPVLEQLVAAPPWKAEGAREIALQLANRALSRLRKVEVAEPAWLDRIPEPIDRPVVDTAALIDAVLAAPTDPAPREILRDALLENGDPRGALMLHQAQNPDPEDKTTLKMLRQHRANWIGPLLERVLENVRFRDGFLDYASLAGNSAASPEEWQQAAEDPHLATLAELSIGRSNRQNYLRFLQSPAARSLIAAVIAGREMLEPIASGPHAARIEYLYIGFGPRPAEWARIAEAFPSVHDLQMKTSKSRIDKDVAALKKHGIATRLKTVDFHGCPTKAIKAAQVSLGL